MLHMPCLAHIPIALEGAQRGSWAAIFGDLVATDFVPSLAKFEFLLLIDARAPLPRLLDEGGGRLPNYAYLGCRRSLSFSLSPSRSLAHSLLPLVAAINSVNGFVCKCANAFTHISSFSFSYVSLRLTPSCSCPAPSLLLPRATLTLLFCCRVFIMLIFFRGHCKDLLK